MSCRPHIDAGFTLIELAIGLVIIALITVSVLQGRELIGNAEYSTFKRSLADHVEAFDVFRQRYHGVPGDYDDAAAQADFDQSGGDGNGLIAGMRCTDNADESCRAWQHLRAASLIRGDAGEEGDDASPAHAYGGRITGFFTGDAGNDVFGHKLLVQGVPLQVAERLDADVDDGQCDAGRIASIDDCNDSDWVASADGTVEIVYAL